MGSKTMLAMRPQCWRQIAAVEYAEGGESSVARLIDRQGATAEDLAWLVQAGLLQVTAGGVAVAVQDLTPTGQIYSDVTLTDAARRLLVRDRAWLVLQVFRLHRHNGRGHPIAVLRNVSGADDEVLRCMEAAHLVQADNPQTHEPIPLAAFTKVPARLRVRLLHRGHDYLPRT
ncbi:hypothetical protein ACFO1B_30900 [Dactylosporangium siamense]|uniref:Uncharacterized protein n=1 Tax=Dactylosporangium siamense TaxID=685454 RepID=A0A919UA29_9ACTN|nr:hypothetical protein [Dactylosporangium siamense]GIG48114.1 hypothetical protein Dsi01nite_061550 [Dactylosporangium siamense]